MPRQSRIDTAGALHHIIARGIERCTIFDDDQDRYLDHLDCYPFTGHCVIMGKNKQPWQNSKKVLGHFGKMVGSARLSYKEFVALGITYR